MVRQVHKVLEVTQPEVVPKVANETSKVVPKTLVLNLFDMDPCIEPKRPIRIDLDLDQLEEEE